MINPGWHEFACKECRCVWRHAVRDYVYCGGDFCPKCDRWETPRKSWPDPKLKCDAKGRLIDRPADVIVSVEGTTDMAHATVEQLAKRVEELEKKVAELQKLLDSRTCFVETRYAKAVPVAEEYPEEGSSA